MEEEMDYFTLYLITRLDALRFVFAILPVILCFVCLSLSEEYKHYAKRILLGAVVSVFLFVVTPTKKDLLMIYAAHALTNSETVDKTLDVMGRLPDVINQAFDRFEREMKK